jgi:hypothetical protein
LYNNPHRLTVLSAPGAVRVYRVSVHHEQKNNWETSTLSEHGPWSKSKRPLLQQNKSSRSFYLRSSSSVRGDRVWLNWSNGSVVFWTFGAGVQGLGLTVKSQQLKEYFESWSALVFRLM